MERDRGYGCYSGKAELTKVCGGCREGSLISDRGEGRFFFGVLLKKLACPSDLGQGRKASENLYETESARD